MASLQENLSCAICLLLLRDPVTLPCGHNFCEQCIRRWGRECPTCRKPLPDAALPRNVQLSELAETVRAQEGSRPAPGAPRDPGPAPRPDARCPRHGWPLQLFCRTEGRGVCCACTEAECRGHQRALLSTVRREREAQLRAGLEVQQQQLGQAERQRQELKRQVGQVQTSACTLASVVSSKFSCLLQTLEMRRACALRDMEEAKNRALAQAGAEEQRLQRHLQALSEYCSRARSLLEQSQSDDLAFLQGSQHLFPPTPVEPLSPPRWDEEQLVGGLRKWLGQLAALLEEERPLRAPAEAAGLHPPDAPATPKRAPNTLCPRRKNLRQNYRNLTFDPSSANRHLHLSRQDQRVEHRLRPRHQGADDSFELWQVMCRQSFAHGCHYWEVRASGHSVTLGVAYGDLPRRKVGSSTDNIGRGSNSWGLCIQEDTAQAWHDGKAQRLPRVPGRVFGMDLDLASGHLTFYSLEPETRCLHTFSAIFTQPLYPVFWLLEGRKLSLLQQPEATPTAELQATPTPEIQATPTTGLQALPTPELEATATRVHHQATHPSKLQTTPAPELQATPTPDPQATPTPELQATPTPDPQATPTPEFQATPTPDPQATPTPGFQATPIPDLHTTPTSEFQATPTAEIQTTPTTGLKATPTPQLQALLIPELEATAIRVHQAANPSALLTTPTPELQATPIPDTQATPTSEFPAKPIPDPQATPNSEFQATAIPDPQATPNSEFQATPIPDPQATPNSEFQVTPTSELRATLILTSPATCNSELQVMPIPDVQEEPLGASREMADEVDTAATLPASPSVGSGAFGPLGGFRSASPTGDTVTKK